MSIPMFDQLNNKYTDFIKNNLDVCFVSVDNCTVFTTFTIRFRSVNGAVLIDLGYDACPVCKVHGHAIGIQVFYSYSQAPSPRKTGDDYLRLSTVDLPRSTSSGIKGPTPLTKIMLFPIQIAVDYMDLVWTYLHFVHSELFCDISSVRRLDRCSRIYSHVR